MIGPRFLRFGQWVGLADAAIGAVLVVYALVVRPPDESLRNGVVLIAVGLAAFFWSRRALGRVRTAESHGAR